MERLLTCGFRRYVVLCIKVWLLTLIIGLNTVFSMDLNTFFLP